MTCISQRPASELQRVSNVAKVFVDVMGHLTLVCPGIGEYIDHQGANGPLAIVLGLELNPNFVSRFIGAFRNRGNAIDFSVETQTSHLFDMGMANLCCSDMFDTKVKAESLYHSNDAACRSSETHTSCDSSIVSDLDEDESSHEDFISDDGDIHDDQPDNETDDEVNVSRDQRRSAKVYWRSDSLDDISL